MQFLQYHFIHRTLFYLATGFTKIAMWISGSQMQVIIVGRISKYNSFIWIDYNLNHGS